MKQTILLVLLACALTAYGSEPARELPSRNADVVLPLLRALPSGSTYADAYRILGEPDSDVGIASPNALYKLSDGSSIHMTTCRLPPDYACKIKTITFRWGPGATDHEVPIFDVPPKA